MAGIMERIRLIALAEANELREKYEDPEKAVNEAIAEAMVTYTKLKDESASVYEGEAQARERMESLSNEADRWHVVARKALAAGNEADARLALSRRQDLLDRLKSPTEIYEQAHQVAERFRQRLAELEDDINRLQAKMALIKAREATVQATEKIGGMASGSTDAAQALREFEAQSAWDLAQAEGMAEARQTAASDPFDELQRMMAEQQAMAQAQADAAPAPATPTATELEIDAALAALKAQVERGDDDDDDERGDDDDERGDD